MEYRLSSFPPLPADLSLSDVPALGWVGIAIAALVVIVLLRHWTLVKFPLWIINHTLYRLNVHGAENVPKTGPCLLVSNHVSWIDAFMIMAANRRKVRFVIWAAFLNIPVIRWILRFAKVIPIDPRSGPRAIVQALRTASDALANGELVCIFAEGGITRTGFLLPFTRGFEQIVKKTRTPIVPVCLDHVWGSIFSYREGKFFWKWPEKVPRRVYVSFGPPMPPDSDAFTVRAALQKLSADSGIRRAAARQLVHRRFVRMACRHPFRSCLIDPNASKPILRYGEVLAGVKLLNKRLRPIVKDDNMVGVWLPSSAGGAIVNMCLATLGKTSVNLNYTVSHDVVQSSIRQCHIKTVITSKLFRHKVPLDAGEGVNIVDLEDFRKGITSFERIMTMASVLCIPGWVQERWIMGLGVHKHDDLATIIFSSGSTGEPKGVMLTHGNIAANCESVIQAIDPTPKDRLFGILPFFHSFGYTVTLWVPMQVGASIAYHPNPLQAREIGEMCKKFACTIFLATPTFLRTYLKRCDPADFASVRLLVCGAEKLPQALAKEFKDKFGVQPLEGYGCTELSPVAAVNVPDWHEGSRRQIGNKSGTIGQPIPGVAARVVHKEDLSPLPPGQEGLLEIFGANVMRGYLGKDDLTKKKVVDGGWYITGDLATIDDDGFITITGREERFAKVGGEMVPLEKVEEELHHVLESTERVAVVTAIPDTKRGERLIVLHLPLNGATPGDVSKKLGTRGLPNLFIPGPRDFFLVDELPILGSGKLDLKKCRQKAEELAGKE
jgi:acyl-[acyl-carrier-protein]-phospholipid O-acyltransferase/long-chain-fatty-acid--[acyl-carrier-protein] ligase